MREFVDYNDWPFPYLYDESQDVARALDALVTPHVFVYDGDQRLVYHGAPDGDHQDPVPGRRLAADGDRRGATGSEAVDPCGQHGLAAASVKWKASRGQDRSGQ